MIKVEHLHVNYDHNEVLKDITLSIKDHSITTIIGPNGCGKSTLLKAMSKNLAFKEGIITLGGKDIKKISTKEYSKSLALLPQNPQIPGDFTVKELLSFGRYPFIKFGGRMSSKDYKVVDWALEKTDMKGFKCRRVKTLSGGERQRAWIAMALAQEPKILLLDEPTTYLDIAHQFEVLELIKEINLKMAMTIIMVLHDINHAARYSDDIIVMKEGRLIKHGNVAETINSDTMENVFSLSGEFLDYGDYPHFIPEKSHKH